MSVNDLATAKFELPVYVWPQIIEYILEPVEVTKVSSLEVFDL